MREALLAPPSCRPCPGVWVRLRLVEAACVSGILCYVTTNLTLNKLPETGPLCSGWGNFGCYVMLCLVRELRTAQSFDIPTLQTSTASAHVTRVRESSHHKCCCLFELVGAWAPTPFVFSTPQRTRKQPRVVSRADAPNLRSRSAPARLYTLIDATCSQRRRSSSACRSRSNIRSMHKSLALRDLEITQDRTPPTPSGGRSPP